jgi:hypothetical protein
MIPHSPVLSAVDALNFRGSTVQARINRDGVPDAGMMGDGVIDGRAQTILGQSII